MLKRGNQSLQEREGERGRELRSSTIWPECLLKNLPPVSKDTCTQQRQRYREVNIYNITNHGSGTGPLQYRSRPGRDTACQGKGKFGKLGGEKSCIVVYGSAQSSECEAHGPSATATI